jgi:hypothetical protein
MKSLLLFMLGFVPSFYGQNAYIQISGEPDLTVYLNNVFSCQTTSEMKGCIISDVKPGKNLIRVEKKNHIAFEEYITLKPGEVLEYKVKPFSKSQVQVSQDGNTEITDEKAEAIVGTLVVQSLPIQIKIHCPKLSSETFDKAKDQWKAEQLLAGTYEIFFILGEKKISKTIEIKKNISSNIFVNMYSGEINVTSSVDDKLIKAVQDKKNEDKLAKDTEKYNKKQARQLLRDYERKNARNIGFAAFRLGLASPRDAKSKDLISYAQWDSSPAFSAPFVQGEFGLKKGFTFGFTGIASLDRVNKVLPSRLGLGIILDANFVALKYDWKDLAIGNPATDQLFNKAKYSVFFIPSFGTGLSLSYQPLEEMVIDFFFRPDINFYTGGSYKVETTLDDGRTFSVASERDEFITAKFGKTFGINFRYNQFFMGLEFRSGMIDRASYTETVKVSASSFYQSYSDKRIITTPGLNLNHIGLTIGIIMD